MGLVSEFASECVSESFADAARVPFREPAARLVMRENADRRAMHDGDTEAFRDGGKHPAGSGAGSGAGPGAACEARGGAPVHNETAGRGAEHPAGAGSRLRRKASQPTSPGGGRRNALSSADDRWYRLASRLTERDRAVVRAVGRFGVLTSDQLAAMFFDSTGRAQVRLLALHRMGLLDRFRPWRAGFGAEPYHYVLGRTGAALLAAEDGEDSDSAARRRRRAKGLALAQAQRLAHLVGINGFHVALAGAARRSGRCELEDWMTEAEAARWSSGIVRPDGWGRWREGAELVEFFVEWDRGTEALHRLVAKLEGYERFEAERGAAAWVLFVLPSARREGTARAALAGAGVAVATAAAEGGRVAPAEAVWLPLDRRHGARLRLAELARVAMPEEAVARAAAAAPRAWFFDRTAEREAGAAW
jgi:hypothetical protein